MTERVPSEEIDGIQDALALPCEEIAMRLDWVSGEIDQLTSLPSLIERIQALHATKHQLLMAQALQRVMDGAKHNPGRFEPRI